MSNKINIVTIGKNINYPQFIEFLFFTKKLLKIQSTKNPRNYLIGSFISKLNPTKVAYCSLNIFIIKKIGL